MSRLDKHVALVRNKLAFQRLLDALAWGALGYVVLAWVAILVYKLTAVKIPGQSRVAQLVAAIVVIGAAVYALLRRPHAEAAAVAIDDKLSLKEKFSTALSVQQSSDPFARAVVLDAEQTAQSVRLDKKFPLIFPRTGYAAIVTGFLVFLTVLFIPAMDLLGRESQAKKAAEHEQIVQEQAKSTVNQALAILEAMPKPVVDADSKLVPIQRELMELAAQPMIKDPEGAKRKAVEALQEAKDDLKEAGERDRKVVDERNRELNDKFSNMDETGPMDAVIKDLKKNDLDKATKDLANTVENFQNMKPEEQEKATKQMEAIAQKMAEMANDPKKEEEIAKQIQDAGIPPDQAKKLAQQMQQAANGDKQAQQNLTQQAQQMQQQLSQQAQQLQAQASAGNPAAQQQLAQIKAQQSALQKAMQAGQSQANSQAQANAMSQAAQQMASAMKNQSGAQQGKQPGGQQPGGSQQAMSQAQQAMKNAAAQMQQASADQQNIAAQQAAAAQAAQNAVNGNGNGNGQGNQPGNQAGANKPGGNNGQWNQGNPNNQGAGQGQAGIGNGGSGDKQFAPSAFKTEMDPSQEDEKGRLLSGTLIKDHSPTGKSKATLVQIGESKFKEGTDEVEADRISGPSRKAAEEYFRTMGKE